MTGVREGDERVSETYQKLHAPRTPDHLNKAILRLADNNSGGQRFAAFAPWMKPAAWAATAVLSLAVVAQFSELPDSPRPADKAAAIAPASNEVTVGDRSTSRAPEEPVLEELILKDSANHKSEARERINSHAASAPAAGAIRSASCAHEARQSAVVWMECVHDLRESGAIEEADREYRALLLEFPAAAATSEPNK